MARVVAYEVEVRGIRGVIQNQNDLTEAIKATRRAFRESDFGSEQFKKSEKELASLKNLQARFRQDVRDTAREQTIAADKGKGSYRALNAELVNLRRRFKELTAEQRQSFGPAYLSRIQQLDKELKDIDASIGQYQRNVGNYRDAFADLGGIDLSALASGPGAILAIGTAAIESAQYLRDMSMEVRELQSSVELLVDGTADELDEFTSRIIGIANTFDQDGQQILNAANAVSDQLGISFESALSRIEEGFIAGSNQTDEFVSNLLEYPTQFRAVFGEGEAAADALFNSLNVQATTGIFSDKGLDTIKEAGLALRELPQVTRDAIDAIGLDSNEIERLIADEGIGKAIEVISTQLGTLREDSPEVGQALADIFKGAGEDAGFEFVVGLQNINKEYGNLIDTESQYQQEKQRTLEVEQEFAAAQVEVANALGGAGATVDNITTQVKTFLLQAVVPIIEATRDWFAAVRPVGDALARLARVVGIVDEGTDGAGLAIKAFTGFLNLAVKPVEIFAKGLENGINLYTDFIGLVKSAGRFVGILGPEEEGSGFGGAGAGGSFAPDQPGEESPTKKASAEVDDLTKKLNSQALAAKRSAVATDEFAKGSLKFLQAELQSLQKQLDEGNQSDSSRRSLLADIIRTEDAIQDIKDARVAIRNEVSRLNDDVSAVLSFDQIGTVLTASGFVPPPEDVIPFVEQTADAIATKQDEFDQRLTDKILENQKDRAERQKMQAVQDAEDRAAAVSEIEATIFGGINDTLNALTIASNTRQENEINNLEERYEREIELAEGNDERQLELREELEAERAAIERREFERQKRFRTAAALTSLAEGVVNILATPSTIPEPFTAPFKAARIAFLTGTTLAQIANIQAQQAARGVSVDPVGRMGGPLHSGPNQGSDVILNGRRIKVESGEIIDRDETGAMNVINRRSSAAFGPQLRAIRGVQFAGKRRYMSAINSYKGFGIPFARDGATVRPSSASIVPLSPGSSAPSVVQVSPEAVSAIAGATAEAVRNGAAIGVAQGMDAATRNGRRRARLSKRTKVA